MSKDDVTKQYTAFCSNCGQWVQCGNENDVYKKSDMIAHVKKHFKWKHKNGRLHCQRCLSQSD